MSGQEDDVRLTLADCRKVGYCVPAMRRWCDEYGIDFREFVRHGIMASELPDDYHVTKAVEKARERERGR